MSDLMNLELIEAKQPKNRVFYRCEKPLSPTFGLSEDSVIVTGLTLVPYYTVEFDFVQDSINEVSAETALHIPEKLEPGMVLEALVTNVSRDWESGHIDDWEIEFKAVTDADELAWIEAMREEARQYEEAEEEMVQLGL